MMPPNNRHNLLDQLNATAHDADDPRERTLDEFLAANTGKTKSLATASKKDLAREIIRLESVFATIREELANAAHIARAAEAIVRDERVTLWAERKHRIYVAGPMNGIADHNFPAFNAAAATLREQGWSVANPAEHNIVPNASWSDYMAFDVHRLGLCGAIYLLPGWSKSKGASAELRLAQTLRYQVLSHPDAEPVPTITGTLQALFRSTGAVTSGQAYTLAELTDLWLETTWDTADLQEWHQGGDPGENPEEPFGRLDPVAPVVQS